MTLIAPDFSSVHSVCDWMELTLLCESEKVSKSRLNRILNSNGVDSAEVFITDVFSELRRRQVMMGSDSLFFVENDSIVKRGKYTWENVPEYVMCLIFSLQGVKKIKGDSDGTKLFERVSKDAIASYLDGEAILLGFPNDKGLNDQLIDFQKSCHEVKSRDRVPANTDKDKGVDIIGWKPHLDGRYNQLILLIQAAAGFHWNLKKPISKSAWRDFFMWSAPVNIGIIIANTLDEINFDKARDDYDLVFDRVRFFISFYRRNLEIDLELRASVEAWCRKELNFVAA